MNQSKLASGIKVALVISASALLTACLSNAESNETSETAVQSQEARSITQNQSASFRSGQDWNGFVYETMTSETTGRVWLDRNLSSAEACVPDNPELTRRQQQSSNRCRGGLYQWGANYSGESRKNADEPLESLDVAEDYFYGISLFSVVKNDWVLGDEDGAIRYARWSATDGSSICPSGFRVPTLAEVQAENLTTDNMLDLFNLKTTDYRAMNYSRDHAQMRRPDRANTSQTGIWTTDFDKDQSRPVVARITQNGVERHVRNATEGWVVRCIQHED